MTKKKRGEVCCTPILSIVEYVHIARPIETAAKKLGAVFLEKASLEPINKAPKVTEPMAAKLKNEKSVQAKAAKTSAVKATPSPRATGKTTETCPML